MKHTKHKKPVTLGEARDRAGLTQVELEALSGVDRTWISKLERRAGRVLFDTYENLDGALRRCGALKANEKLVFGPPASQREAVAS